VAKLCLKARPTVKQLADRLQPIEGEFPQGLELYLDAADIRDEKAMATAVANLEAHALSPDFALLIEGPVGSLDGEFFDVTRESPADYLVVKRLADMARRIGAKAVNIHLIAPTDDVSLLNLECRQDLLRRSLPILRHFVELMQTAGATPTIEDMPAVLRMRQGGYYFSPIGMPGADLHWAAEQVPGLKLLPDTSHAGLYLNARAAAFGRRPITDEERLIPWLDPFLDYVRQLPDEPDSLLGYFQSLQPYVVNAQISNASGLLGEGLPYDEGDYDLDPTIQWLGQHAQHIVTETLEPNQDDAVYMRDALVQMRRVVA